MSSAGCDRGDPPRQEQKPNWCWVAEEWGGPRVGQAVRVPGILRTSEIFEIWSHRLGGGVWCTLVFPDRSWVTRRALDVVRHNAGAREGDAL